MEPAVMMVLRREQFFPFLHHGTSLETRGFGEVSSRGPRPLLKFGPVSTAGGIPGGRRRK